MGAFTLALVLADLWSWRRNRAIKHAILGGISTALFFTLCQRGYEMVNWSFLGLFVLLLLFPLISLGYDDSCDTCE